MKADETIVNYAELSDYLILPGGGSPFRASKWGNPLFGIPMTWVPDRDEVNEIVY